MFLAEKQICVIAMLLITEGSEGYFKMDSFSFLSRQNCIFSLNCKGEKKCEIFILVLTDFMPTENYLPSG